MNSLRRSILLRNKLSSVISNKPFSTTCVKYEFWEKDFKGGYNKDRKELSIWEHIKNGWKELKDELTLLGQEAREKFEADPIINYQPGMIDKQWEFKTEKDLINWVKTCDSDHGEGFSSCAFTINKNGHGLFSGVLDTTVPKDGRVKRAGYCSIRSIRPRRSFKRDAYIDWSNYTHLVIRLRGDGRSYMINIATSGYFDQFWNDMYQYVLYTRGGPYWQVTKIPFSKFFFSSKGRIQDTQDPLPQDRITNFSITAADKVNGPFSLEIDYIGCEFDPTHTETFAYEMYETQRNIAAN